MSTNEADHRRWHPAYKVGLLVVVAIIATWGAAYAQFAGEKRAALMIESLGGEYSTHTVGPSVLGLFEIVSADLSRTSVTDKDLAMLNGLKALQAIVLTETQISDTGLGYLQRLPSLRGLYLSRTRISDEGMAHVGRLTSIDTLGLSHTSVTDTGLQHLAYLVRLQTIFATDTKITKEGIAKLKSRILDLDILQ